jgi:FtsP/CotA-like multicopper oxidase with cupredoxin domain
MKSHVGGLPPPAGVVLAGLAIVLAALLPDRLRTGALAQSVPYQEPLVIRSGPDHVLDAAFVARQDSAQIAGQTVGGAWNYHVVGADGVEGPANYPGPTLMVNAGDTIRLRIVNRLPFNASAPNDSITNLHTHGLHVSPIGNSDNVLLAIPTGAENQYEIEIPANHPNGLYWYHPHRHGSVDPQVFMGLSGMISIGSPDSGVFSGQMGLENATERMMALQYSYIQGGQLVNAAAQGLVTVNAEGLAFFNSPQTNMFFTINGQTNPTFDIPAGQTEVWNFANISNNGFFELQLQAIDGTPVPWILVAQDGNPYPAPVVLPAGQGLIVPPAARHSALIQLPPGSYQLLMDFYNDGFFQWPPSFSTMPGGYEQGRAMATITSGGTAPNVPTTLTAPFDLFEPLDREPVDNSRIAAFSMNFTRPDNNFFLINRAPFLSNPVFQLRLNKVEQWNLTNVTPGAEHPFHIHVNDFQLVSQNAPAGDLPNITTPQPWYQDIVLLPFSNGPDAFSDVFVRMKPLDFLGTYVYHCHRVDHEDAAMMALITIIPETPIYAVGSGPGIAPAVRVFSGTNDQQLAEFGPFGASNRRAGVRVAVGDVNHDGVMDVLAVGGRGAEPRVKVFDGKQGFRTLLYDFKPFPSRWRGGLNVAAGDLNSDGYDDMIVAPDSGAPPNVKVFSGKDGTELYSFLAYDKTFRGGVRLAAAVLRDGGRTSLVTAMGPGHHSRPLVKIWDTDWYGTYSPTSVGCRCTLKSCRCGPAPAGSFGAKFPIAETGSVMAYGENFRGGVNLGTGPVNGMSSGFSIVLAAPAEGRTPLVKAFVVTDTSDAHQHGEAPGFPIITELASFQAYDPGMRAGVSVGGVSTLTGADIVTAPVSRAFPRIRRFAYNPSDSTFALTAEFRAFSADTRGATVAAK